MAWAVCIVGKVSAAKAKIAERFDEQRRRPELLPCERETLDLLEKVVHVQIAFMEKLDTSSYVSITAGGGAWQDKDWKGDSEAKLAVRMLPGFVE